MRVERMRILLMWRTRDIFLFVWCCTLSQPARMHAGVPQGSVLGPILFNIFFNDSVETKGDAELALFADDIATSARSYGLSHIERKLQAQAHKMARWSAKWRTKVSINKTKYLVFHKGLNHKQNTLHLTYNNRKLERDPHPVFSALPSRTTGLTGSPPTGPHS